MEELRLKDFCRKICVTNFKIHFYAIYLLPVNMQLNSSKKNKKNKLGKVTKLFKLKSIEILLKKWIRWDVKI